VLQNWLSECGHVLRRRKHRQRVVDALCQSATQTTTCQLTQGG
jgi:hypothetical protein